MKHNKWIVATLLKGGAVVMVLIFTIIITLKFITRHNQELEVPDFSGMSFYEAQILASKNHLRLDVTDSVFIPRMGRGLIFRQNPTAGSFVKKNRRVLLTINSLQPKRVSMPLVTGFSLRQAKAELTARQLNVGRLIYVNDMATNNVLDQRYRGLHIPPGTQIETESEIDLELGLSSDNNLTSIPSLVGFSLITAKDIIIDNSLNVGRLTFDQSVNSYTDTLSSFVISQFPAPSDRLTTLMGSRVDLVLSTDKSKIDAVKNN